MKLVSFQSMEALRKLIDQGYLEADERYINLNKMGHTYEWVVEKMNEYVPHEGNIKFPLWCWVRFKRGICPPKHKDVSAKKSCVKITFEKERKDIFITDYRRYSFLLNNVYIPDSRQDKEQFDNQLVKYGITAEELKAVVRADKYNSHREDKEFLEICRKIRKSFDKCICEESDVLQGCVWRINLDEVLKIEMLKDTDYSYGTFNYVRKNGKRFNWIKDFYDNLLE